MTQFFKPHGPRFASLSPTPLVSATEKLDRALSRQSPIHALFAVRDVMESGIRYYAGLSAAELFMTSGNTHLKQTISEIMLKRGGLSLGDWRAIAETSLEDRDEKTETDFYRKLRSVIFERHTKRRKTTKLAASLFHGNDNFLSWRNKTIGHGVFREDDNWYADSVNKWLPVAQNLLQEISQITAFRSIFAEEKGGLASAVDTTSITNAECSHELLEEPLVLSIDVENNGCKLQLAPFVTAKGCALCGSIFCFFFDKLRNKKNSDKVELIGYGGVPEAYIRNWIALQPLRNHVLSSYEWQRGSFDRDVIDDDTASVLSRFEELYRKPDDVEHVLEALEDLDRGYLMVTGPAGAGKSYLMNGINLASVEDGIPTLFYVIRPGQLSDYRTFVVRIADQAAEKFRFQTQEIQTVESNMANLKHEFANFIEKIMNANHLRELFILVDGLDELRTPNDSGRSIIDLLPSPSSLPRGCKIVLSSRSDLSEATKEAIEFWKSDDRDRVKDHAMDPSSNRMRKFVTDVVRENLPGHLQSDVNARKIVDKNNGIFLYSYSMTELVHSGAYASVDDLPQDDKLYPEYLHRLRSRVGGDFFDSIFLPVLAFFGAINEPISVNHLLAWGVPGQEAKLAISELKIFVDRAPHPNWPERLNTAENSTYQIIHEEVVAYLESDPEMQVRIKGAHRKIARSAVVRNRGYWPDVDPLDEVTLYELKHGFRHCLECGEEELARQLLEDGAYANACVGAAMLAESRGRYPLARYLLEQAIQCEEWVNVDHGDKRRNLDIYRAVKHLASIEHRIVPQVISTRFNKLQLIKEFLDCATGQTDVALAEFEIAETLCELVELDFEILGPETLYSVPNGADVDIFELRLFWTRRAAARNVLPDTEARLVSLLLKMANDIDDEQKALLWTAEAYFRAQNLASNSPSIETVRDWASAGFDFAVIQLRYDEEELRSAEIELRKSSDIDSSKCAEFWPSSSELFEESAHIKLILIKYQRFSPAIYDMLYSLEYFDIDFDDEEHQSIYQSLFAVDEAVRSRFHYPHIYEPIEDGLRKEAVAIAREVFDRQGIDTAGSVLAAKLTEAANYHIRKLGDFEYAESCLREAAKITERLIHEFGRDDLRESFAHLSKTLGLLFYRWAQDRLWEEYDRWNGMNKGDIYRLSEKNYLDSVKIFKKFYTDFGYTYVMQELLDSMRGLSLVYGSIGEDRLRIELNFDIVRLIEVYNRCPINEIVEQPSELAGLDFKHEYSLAAEILANFYVESGEYQNACRIFSVLSRLDPNFPDYAQRENLRRLAEGLSAEGAMEKSQEVETWIENESRGGPANLDS